MKLRLTALGIVTGIFLFFCAGKLAADNEGMFLDFSLGYNFPLSPQVIGVESDFTKIETGDPDPSEDETIYDYYDGSHENIYGSFGQGFGLSAEGGMWMNPNFAITLGFDALFSTTFEVPQDFLVMYSHEGKGFNTEDPTSVDGDDYQYTYSGDITANSYTINPGIKLQLTESRTVNPYAKTGLIMALPQVSGSESLSFQGEINSNFIVDQDNLPDDYEEGDNFVVVSRDYELEFEYDRGFEMGFYSEAGIAINLGRSSDLLIGLNFSTYNYQPEQLDITSLTLNGEDITSEERIRLSETEFTLGDELPFSDDQSARLADVFQFGNFGLNVGYSYSF